MQLTVCLYLKGLSTQTGATETVLLRLNDEDSIPSSSRNDRVNNPAKTVNALTKEVAIDAGNEKDRTRTSSKSKSLIENNGRGNRF